MYATEVVKTQNITHQHSIGRGIMTGDGRCQSLSGVVFPHSCCTSEVVNCLRYPARRRSASAFLHSVVGCSSQRANAPALTSHTRTHNTVQHRTYLEFATTCCSPNGGKIACSQRWEDRLLPSLKIVFVVSVECSVEGFFFGLDVTW